MMDHFDAKRGMVKKLLDMLKEHASTEVSNGLSKPEGEDDMHGLQVEKVEVLPDHKMDEPTPEHDVETKELYNQGGMAYNKGGVVDKVNATDPTPKIHSGPIPYESADGQPDKEGSAHEEVTESTEEREAEGDIKPVAQGDYSEEAEPSSMFKNFLSRKKRK